MNILSTRIKTDSLSLYEIEESVKSSSRVLQRFIASTPESRKITNDPLCIGCEYTELLEDACVKILEGVYPHIASSLKTSFQEHTTSVLHLLRGGLNYGLRNALYRAYGWNRHSASYLSAQRHRKVDSPEDWYITETAYQKVSLADQSVIVCGDVVATGTSLSYAFHEIMDIAKKEGKEISGFVFFTIGGKRAEEILLELETKARGLFPSFVGSVVIYLEGCFTVPTIETPLSIKLTGTDLVRREGLLSEEFMYSQFEHPSYPLERCAIYDAGSRAFSVPEYLEDVLEYWTEVEGLAKKGVTYEGLLIERFPELLDYVPEDFSPQSISLIDIVLGQIRRIKEMLYPRR